MHRLALIIALTPHLALAQDLMPEAIIYPDAPIADQPGMWVLNSHGLSVSPDGAVAFSGNVAGAATSQTGMYEWRNGQINTVAQNGWQAPRLKPGVRFKPRVGDGAWYAGNSLLLLCHVEGPDITWDNDHHLWYGRTGDLRHVLGTGGPVVPGSETTFRQLTPATNLGPDRLAPFATMTDPAAPRQETSGFVSTTLEGERTIFAQHGQEAPGTSGYTFNFTQNLVQDPAPHMVSNSEGQVAFNAATWHGPAGIWTFDDANGLQPAMIDRQTRASGLPENLALVGAHPVALNERGSIAFSSFLWDSARNTPVDRIRNSAIVAGTPRSLRVIAREGDPVPGHEGEFVIAVERFSNGFDDPVFNAAGSIAFAANVAEFGAQDDIGRGIFLDRGNGLETIALTGLLGDPIHFPPPGGFRGPALNDHDDLAFVGHTGPWQSLFVATEGSVLTVLKGGTDIDVAPGVFKTVDTIRSRPQWDEDRNLFIRVRFADMTEAVFRTRVPAPSTSVLLFGGLAILHRRRQRS